MSQSEYWDKLMQRTMRQRMSRRAMLRNAGLAGLGLAGSAILGCSTEQKAQPTAMPTKSSGGSVAPTPSPAAGKTAPKGKITAAVATVGEMLIDPGWGKNGMLYPILFELHDHLVKRDIEGKLAPALASSYRISDDGLAWEFTIRKGAKFHNGDPVTAADAKYSYERLWKPRFLNPNLKTYERMIDRVEVVGEDKVVYYTKGPQPMFLLQAPLHVVPKKYIEQVGDEEYERKPVGAGPYKLAKMVKGESIEYEAFDDYWDIENYPKVKTVVIKVVPEAFTRLAMLRTNEVDLMAGVGGPMIQQVKDLPGCRIFVAERTASNHLQFFKMYDPSNPCSKLQVRQALSHAIDREAIAKKIHFGEAFPLTIGGIPSIAFGNDPTLKPHPYDPEKAKKLLAEAGYPNGFEVEMATYDSASMANIPDQMQAVAGYFEKIGVKTKVNMYETGTYTAKFREKSVPGDMGPMSMPTTGAWDAAYTINTFYTSIAAYSHFKNEKVDKLWEESMTIVDPTKREVVLKKIIKIIFDELLGLGTVETNTVSATGPRIKDWKLQKGMPYLGGLERIVLKE